MPPGKAAYKDRALWDVPVGMLSGVHLPRAEDK